MQWASPKGLVEPKTAMIGICHDDPEITPPEKIRYDAAIPIAHEVQPGGEVGISPAIEFYLNTPQNTRPEDLLTRVCVPLAPA